MAMERREDIIITVPSEQTRAPEQERESKVSVKKKPIYHFFKRVADLFLSIVGLIVCAIPMAVIAALIRIGSPGNPIYVHNRIGKNGKPLPLLKFRTMYTGAEAMVEDFTPEQKVEWEKNFKLEDDPRITRIGRFLRRSSLDELPQLVNVLKGELSIVGPRPIITEELERYGERKDTFLSVTPGLTGYWQAYARSTCTYDERIQMELYYAKNANFRWDVKILFATVAVVLRGKGAK